MKASQTAHSRKCDALRGHKKWMNEKKIVENVNRRKDRTMDLNCMNIYCEKKNILLDFMFFLCIFTTIFFSLENHDFDANCTTKEINSEINILLCAMCMILM